jgi:hypothetical protein
MNPKFAKRSVLNTPREEKKKTAVRMFIEVNTHHSISIKPKYLYLEDVKTAININTLEERIILKRWLLSQLSKGISKEDLIQLLNNSAEMDRHRMQKDYQITI